MKKLGTRELIRRTRNLLLVAKRARERGIARHLVAEQRDLRDRLRREDFGFTTLDWSKAEPPGRDLR